MKIGLLGIILVACKVSAHPLLEQHFHSLIQQYIPNACVGLIIQDLNSGKILYEHQSKDNFYPASNTKLFTAAAALKFFGPNFQYQTSIHAPLEKMKNGVLEDNLTIIFRGDPSLTIEDIDSLAKQLKETGLNHIKGNVIVDDRSFDAMPYAPGWTSDSLAWYYSAPITTIILNENKIRLKVNKPKALNELLKIEQSDQSLPPLKIQSVVKAVSFEDSEKNCTLNATVKNNEITLTGCWAIEKTPTTLEFALDNPKLIAKAAILQALKKVNITLNGQVVFSAAQPEIPVILIKRSLPLKTLLIKVLQDSNNIYTESMTKALGLATFGQGSFQKGTQAIQEILTRESPLEFSQTRLSDGSGQSRYNLISPLLISKLLYQMREDPNFVDYYNALSVSGTNGTLANRMKTKSLTGKIVAKTGSAIGTSTLSGYFTGNSNRSYLFSLMINQSTNDNSLKIFEDKLCEVLVTEPWLTPITAGQTQ